ncbi:Hypothetical predicted protein, partial [Olea europaea subsp. europaea]
VAPVRRTGHRGGRGDVLLGISRAVSCILDSASVFDTKISFKLGICVRAVSGAQTRVFTSRHETSCRECAYQHSTGSWYRATEPSDKI